MVRKRKPLDLSFTKDDLYSAKKYCQFSWIKNAIDNREKYQDLEIGDALVYYHSDGRIRERDGISEKNIIVHIDDYGFIYTKVLSGTKLLKTMTCVTAESSAHGRYEIDPEKIESILLDDSTYDATAATRKMNSLRGKVRRINRKKRFDKVKNDSELVALFKSLTPGDIIWNSSSLGEDLLKLSFSNIEVRDVSGSYYGRKAHKRTYGIFKILDHKAGSTAMHEISENSYYSFHENYYKEKTVSIEEMK